ncbi:hypothetical protein GCM10009416_37230 [Craurococcus roseus]|uniref:Uncharacterized protein n=1 Tax=Craurococcus roseus TaxID=77585 RepID=A0ABP3QQD6_9PROT
MGGLFSAPKPKIVAAPEPAPAAAPVVAAAPEAAAQAAGEEARAENRARAAHGIAGTVATSSRGVLEQLPGLARKSLLGQ